MREVKNQPHWSYEALERLTATGWKLVPILVLMLSMGGIAGAGFLTQVILGRALTVEGYGVLATGMGLITILGAFSGHGIGGFWLKVFGSEGWAGLRWVKPSLTLAAILAVCAVGLTLLLNLTLNTSHRV